jgi:hypothetical protein
MVGGQGNSLSSGVFWWTVLKNFVLTSAYEIGVRGRILGLIYLSIIRCLLMVLTSESGEPVHLLQKAAIFSVLLRSCWQWGCVPAFRFHSNLLI